MKRRQGQAPRTDGAFHVDFGSGPSYDLEAIRQRKEALMPDGGHAWVISSVFSVDDPEQAMDSMELGAENFVGVTGIHCLMCSAPYVTRTRHYKCPQKPPL